MLARRSLFAVPALAAVAGGKGKTVATYLPCAGSPLSVASAADQTGFNSGNLTTAFTTNVLGTMPAIWEWYRCTISTQTPGVTFTPASCSIWRNLKQPLSFTYPAGGTEWDPSQPIQLRQGDEIYFLWDLASSSTPVPVVTLFARYDRDVMANRSYTGGY